MWQRFLSALLRQGNFKQVSLNLEARERAFPEVPRYVFDTAADLRPALEWLHGRDTVASFRRLIETNDSRVTP